MNSICTKSETFSMIRLLCKLFLFFPNKVFSSSWSYANIKFMSNVIEKAASCQVTNHIDSNDLGESYQSSYKRFHSTETALLKVKSDFLQYVDNNKTVLMVLLDMSAAFDTVDHPIILQRLGDRFELREFVASWFQSYFETHTMGVSMGNVLSGGHVLAVFCLRGRSSAHGVLFYVLLRLGVSSVVVVFVSIVARVASNCALPLVMGCLVVLGRLWGVLPCTFLTWVGGCCADWTRRRLGFLLLLAPEFWIWFLMSGWTFVALWLGLPSLSGAWVCVWWRSECVHLHRWLV